MILTFDIGNSRIKWASWESGEIIHRGSTVSRLAELESVFEECSVEGLLPEKVIAVCVAKDRFEQALQDLVRSYWGLAVDFFRTSSTYNGRKRTLIHAYDDVRYHGADRWAGLIAACDEFDGGLCVLSAGTAMTVDLIDADGRHLGGRIMPSLTSLYQAVVTNAAAIESKKQPFSVGEDIDLPDIFASNTEQAICSGIYYMFEAATIEVCSKALEVLGSNSRLIVTGGQAEILLQFRDVPEFVHRPDLVMRGIYAACSGQQAA